MIPKKIHFIWIGKKPQYVDFAINNFKRKNQTCEINFVNVFSQRLEQIYFQKQYSNDIEILIYKTLVDILDNDKYHNLLRFFLNGQNLINHIETPFIQIFCDIFRLTLINKYGGIYIDCDTYPIKPFDDFIFNKKRICIMDNLNNILIKNNYFLATESGDNWENYFEEKSSSIIQFGNQRFTHINKSKTFDFNIRRIKFFKCKLIDDDFKNLKIPDYFEHYSDFRWGTNRIQKTKFDQIFNKEKYLCI